LTCVAAFNCNFVEISCGFANITQDVGLRKVQSNDLWPADDDWDSAYYCTGWEKQWLRAALSSDELDGAMKATRAFGMITIIVSSCVSYGDHDQLFVRIVASLLVFLETSPSWTWKVNRTQAISMLRVLCAKSRTHINFRLPWFPASADSCELQGAGIVAIVASVLRFVCAGLMFVVAKNPRQMRDDTDESVYAVGTHEAATSIPAGQPVKQKEIKTIQNADGSTTITTTTTETNADGGKTVTTTTEVTPLKINSTAVEPLF
jgi:hypothetical protein